MKLINISNKIQFACATFISLLSLQSMATSLPFALPDELIIDNKPLSPLCFQYFVSEQDNVKPVNLQSSSCVKYQQQYNQYALKMGFLGFDLKSNQPSMRPVSIAYKYIGTFNKSSQPMYVFEINWSGGGSGYFSSLVELQKNGDELSLVKTLDGGDRCMGGIHSAKIDGNQLSYQRKVTSQMLIDASSLQTDANLSQPPLFEDCAVCCIGSVNLTDSKVVGVSFNGIIPETENSDSKQQCFNQHILAAGAKNKATLNASQLSKLQKSIKNTCF